MPSGGRSFGLPQAVGCALSSPDLTLVPSASSRFSSVHPHGASGTSAVSPLPLLQHPAASKPPSPLKFSKFYSVTRDTVPALSDKRKDGTFWKGALSCPSQTPWALGKGVLLAGMGRGGMCGRRCGDKRGGRTQCQKVMPASGGEASKGPQALLSTVSCNTD